MIERPLDVIGDHFQQKLQSGTVTPSTIASDFNVTSLFETTFPQQQWDDVCQLVQKS
jgi:hypothetical protein